MPVRFQEQKILKVWASVSVCISLILYSVKRLFYGEPVAGLHFGLFQTIEDMGIYYRENIFLPYSILDQDPLQRRLND
jgi:hypothetical protein